MQPYKYNGKELDRTNKLDWYDYGARMYDPQIGRFHTVDPMADQRIWVSPYSYCQNNPIGRIDSDGALDDIVITGEDNSSVTLKTDLIDINVDASSLGNDFGGNYSFAGEDLLVAALDVAGIFDPTGAADIAAGSIEMKNGNFWGGLASYAGIAVGVGDLAKTGKIPKHLKTIEKAIDDVKTKNLKEAAEKGIPKSQLGPSGKPKIHTVSKPNLKQAKDAARNNPKSNTSPVKHSSDKGQKTHYHSTKDGKKMTRRTMYIMKTFHQKRNGIK